MATRPLSTLSIFRLFVLVPVVVLLGAVAHGCGRTSLDEGFTSTDGSASAGATGSGGQSGAGGQGGVGAGSLVTCGSSQCVAGMQSCCNRLDATGRAIQTCIATTDPSGCLDGVVLCSADILCPNAAPSCCIQAFGVGYCQPAGLVCMALRP